jgi:hypothetical protein
LKLKYPNSQPIYLKLLVIAETRDLPLFSCGFILSSCMPSHAESAITMQDVDEKLVCTSHQALKSNQNPKQQTPQLQSYGSRKKLSTTQREKDLNFCFNSRSKILSVSFFSACICHNQSALCGSCRTKKAVTLKVPKKKMNKAMVCHHLTNKKQIAAKKFLISFK